MQGCSYVFLFLLKIPDIYLCKSMCEPCTWKHRHVYVVQSSHVLGKLGKKSLQEGEWKKEEGNGVNKYQMILALDGH